MVEYTNDGLEKLRGYAKSLDGTMEELMIRKDRLDLQISELDDLIFRYSGEISVFEQMLGGE